MIAPDTSVVIAAASSWHTAHAAAVAALAAAPCALLVHVAYETTAALSRMPEGQRVAPGIALDWLERRFDGKWLALPPDAARTALRAAVASGVRGGALYDALIAATAVHHGRRLVSADRRAAASYAAVGADVIYVETS